MNTLKKDYHKTNIYQSCHGEIKRNVYLNRNEASLSFPEAKTKKQLLKCVVESKDASFIVNKGSSVPPDEILQYINPTAHWKIPLRPRDDFAHSAHKGELPLLDLLNALHYYTSERVCQIEVASAKDRIHRSLDETALLAFGSMLEEMADSIIAESGVGIFLENSSHTPAMAARGSSVDSDLEDGDEDVSEDDESENENQSNEDNRNLSDISF